MKMLFGMYNRCKSATRVMLFGNKSYKKKAKLLTVKDRLVRLDERIVELWSNSSRIEGRLRGHKISMELSIIEQNKIDKEVNLINTLAQNNANKLIELEARLEKTTTIIYSLLNKKADKRGRKAKK